MLWCSEYYHKCWKHTSVTRWLETFFQQLGAPVFDSTSNLFVSSRFSSQFTSHYDTPGKNLNWKQLWKINMSRFMNLRTISIVLIVLRLQMLCSLIEIGLLFTFNSIKFVKLTNDRILETLLKHIPILQYWGILEATIIYITPNTRTKKNFFCRL